MSVVAAALCGFVLDLLLADPPAFPHPVVWMGRAIGVLERFLRPRFPQTRCGQRAAGAVLAAALPGGTLALSGAVCLVTWRIHPALGFAVQVLWSWQALAVRGLAQESRRVYEQLRRGDLAAARRAVGRIVGRDTERLDEAGVTRAAVETVAENFADGVVAPLMYLLLGGAPLALCYKAINTMDSMVGYKNERYIDFGRAAARLDDAANYLPSRLAALLWIAAACLTGQNGSGAWRIWRRDRRCHASPNSAQTEAACAGALGVQLGGPAYYFGALCPKDTIGDAARPVEDEDILRANRMLYTAALLALAALCALRAGLWYVLVR